MGRSLDVTLAGMLTALSGLLAMCPVLATWTPEAVVKGVIGLVKKVG